LAIRPVNKRSCWYCGDKLRVPSIPPSIVVLQWYIKPVEFEQLLAVMRVR